MAEPIFFKRKCLDTERAKELYDKGYCDQQIADICGVSRDAVNVWRRKNKLVGHKAPHKEKKKKESTLVEMAVEAKKHGMSYGEYMVAKREGKV